MGRAGGGNMALLRGKSHQIFILILKNIQAEEKFVAL
jgi:hypothetical protein